MFRFRDLAVVVAVLSLSVARCAAERAATLRLRSGQAGGRPYASAGPQRSVKRVVVFVLDRISLPELMQADMPNLRRILPRAAVGLMSGGIVGRPSERTIWTTLGAGCPASDAHAVPGLLFANLGKAGVCVDMVALRRGTGLEGMAGWKWHPLRGARQHNPVLEMVHGSGAVRDLRELDRAIGEVARSMRSEGRLILLSMSAPRIGSIRNAALCPFIVFGQGIESGLLTSASTRRPGLVAAVDFAPTVLAWFGVKIPDRMTGHPARILPHAAPLDFVARLDRQAALTYAQRFPLVKFYIAVQAAVFALAAWAGLLRRGAPRVRRIALAGVLVCAALPLGVMAAGALQAPSAWQAAVTALAAAALLAWLALALGPLRGMAFACALVVVAIVADLLTGGHLMQGSVLGHDPIIGARFYGIGNEHMAIALGAAAIGLGFWRQARQSSGAWWVAAVGWVALILLIGAPQVGANLGGAMTGALMLPVVVWPRSGRIQVWHLAAGAAAVGLTAMVVVHLDLLRQPAAQTHIGQSARLVGAHGLAVAWALLAHRLAISLGLFLYTPLNLLGLVICASAVVWTGLAPAGAREIRRQRPWAWSGLGAAALGAVGATVFNDSGVVAGGNMMTYVLSGLLAMCVIGQMESGCGGQDTGA